MWKLEQLGFIKKIEDETELDYMTVYLNGFYDGEKKVKDKIKAKIRDIEEYKSTNEVDEFGIHSMNWLVADNMQETLKSLL